MTNRNPFRFTSCFDRHYLLLLILLLGMGSCSLIHYLYTTDPADETGEQISSYLESLDIPYDYSLLLLDSVWYKLNEERHFLNRYKHSTGASASPIQLRLYNKKGEIINGYSQCYGDYKKFDFLNKDVEKLTNLVPTNYNLRLEDEFEMFDITEATKKEILLKARESDRIILCYWNIWSKYFSKVVLKGIRKYKQNHPDERTLIILVNTGLDPHTIKKYSKTNNASVK